MNFFLLFCFSFFLAFAITPAVIWIYRKKKWLDDPTVNPHPKVVHTHPIPRGGGIAVFLTMLLSILFFIPLQKYVIGIVSGAWILALTGFWDDLMDPPPILRFGLQILAGVCVIAAGIGIAFVTNPLTGGVIHLDQPQIAFFLLGKIHTVWIISDILALLWIVWCMNIVNFSKGLDGQMPGYVVVAALVIAILSARFGADPSQLLIARLAVLLAGTFAGFLIWNAYPQKIMVGFGGSTLAGFFLGVLSILSGAKLATAILVLAIPMLDAAFVILGRVRMGKSPLLGDRSHLHHRLMDLGWGKRRIAFFYWISAAILGTIALQLKSEQKAFTIAAVGVATLGILIWLRFFTTHFGKSAPVNGSKT